MGLNLCGLWLLLLRIKLIAILAPFTTIFWTQHGHALTILQYQNKEALGKSMLYQSPTRDFIDTARVYAHTRLNTTKCCSQNLNKPRDAVAKRDLGGFPGWNIISCEVRRRAASVTNLAMIIGLWCVSCQHTG